LYLGVTEDAYIVPVSISYDRLVDGNFVSEQMVDKHNSLRFSLVTQSEHVKVISVLTVKFHQF